MDLTLCGSDIFDVMMDYDDCKKKLCSSMNFFTAIEDASPKAKDFFIKFHLLSPRDVDSGAFADGGADEYSES
jgi:hypothetical protein